MAVITTVIATSHSPFLFQPLEWWDRVRKTRPLHEDVPRDSEAENFLKRERTESAMASLREVFQRARPDVMVVFGDDQKEQFQLSNMPAFAIYGGQEFAGYKGVAYEGIPGKKQMKPHTPDHWATVPCRQDLAQSALQEVLKSDFDPAFMLNMANTDHGMGHAFMRPANVLTGGKFDVPVVPVLVNCFYAPQPTAARCVKFARAMRRAIESWPADLRVAVVGSGGLWHLPGAPNAYIDAHFDTEVVRLVQEGKADELAGYFDNWKPETQAQADALNEIFSGGTGMRGGLGTGTGETRTWIMAAAVADRPGVLVDYVPVYSSPCGMGFAYWEMGEAEQAEEAKQKEKNALR